MQNYLCKALDDFFPVFLRKTYCWPIRRVRRPIRSHCSKFHLEYVSLYLQNLAEKVFSTKVLSRRNSTKLNLNFLKSFQRNEWLGFKFKATNSKPPTVAIIVSKLYTAAKLYFIKFHFAAKLLNAKHSRTSEINLPA